MVPVHDGERWLGEALESIAAQTYPDVETVVVDDGSTDGSAAVIARFPGVLALSQPASGAGLARNAGIAAATGELIAFCDQDDVLDARKLEVQAAHLADHPEADLVLARQRPLLEPGATLPDWARPDRTFGDAGGVLPLSALVRRTAFDRVGVFDPTLPGAEDADWLYRARRAGLGIAVLDEILMTRRIHADNLSHDEALVRESLFQSIRKLTAGRGEAD